MKITFPHWFTIVVAVLGAAAGSLVTQLPAYAGLLGSIAGICAVLAAPNLESKRRDPPAGPPGAPILPPPIQPPGVGVRS